MACLVCKQGRDNIRVKVNVQSLIPASFYTSLQLYWRDSIIFGLGMRLYTCAHALLKRRPSQGTAATECCELTRVNLKL